MSDTKELANKAAEAIGTSDHVCNVWIKDGVAPRVYITCRGQKIGYAFVKADGSVGLNVSKERSIISSNLRSAGISVAS